jgi:predicted nucleic acid-binding protein
MRVLFDSDVVLDVLLDRPGFAEPATALFDANEEGRLDGYISAITPVNVFYIARKLKGAERARRIAGELLTVFRVCRLDQETLQIALPLPLADYEDAVQLASALAAQLDAIVTRNLEDYKNATLPVFSPAELLARILKGSS